MPRRLVNEKKKRQACPENIWRFLNDEDDVDRDFDIFLLQGNLSECQRVWALYGNQVLREWIIKKPGTRPSMWWDCVFNGNLKGKEYYERKKIHPSKQPRFLANRNLLTEAEMKIVGACSP